MDLSTTQLAFVLSGTAGAFGLLLFAHARLQARMLGRRIASGAGSVVVDPATGLFSAAAAWQCIRAEANRAARLERPLDVWVARAGDAAELDTLGREVAFALPGGAMGVRLDRRHLCVLSCAGLESPDQLAGELTWTTRRLPHDGDADAALRFVSEVTGAA